MPKHVPPMRFPSSRQAKAEGISHLWMTAKRFASGKDAEAESDVVEYIAGYIVHKRLQRNFCLSCEEVLRENVPTSSTFMRYKDYTEGALERPNKLIVATLKKAEEVFVAGEFTIANFREL